MPLHNIAIMSTVPPKVKKSQCCQLDDDAQLLGDVKEIQKKPRREQLIAEQLKDEQGRLKELDKNEREELEARSFLASFTDGKCEYDEEGECICDKYFAAMLIFHYEPTLLLYYVSIKQRLLGITQI